MTKNTGTGGRENLSLRPLYDDQTLVLEATSGSNTFASSADIYTGHLDPLFKEYELGGPGKPSPKTPFGISEMYSEGGNSTLAELFTAINADIENLRLPQEQARNFAREHPDKLHPEGLGTYILFTKNDEPVKADKSNVFVVEVGLYEGKLTANCNEFSVGGTWYGELQSRVVYRK